MNNIVIMEWYDKATNQTYTALDFVSTESEAIKVAMGIVKDWRKKGIEGIASAIDRKTLNELIAKGFVDNYCYDPEKNEYCKLSA